MNHRDYQAKMNAKPAQADPAKTEKILDRIRKLLAMSKDSSSPHEAAIAARRARAMMDEYQVSELDLTQVSPNDFGVANTTTGTRTQVMEVGQIAMACAKLNDCIVVGDRNYHGSLYYTFKGLLADSVCAAEMFKWLRDDMYRYAERVVEGRSARRAYRLGFATGIHQQVERILEERNQLKEKTTGTSLVVAKRAIVEQHFGVQQYGSRRSKTNVRGTDVEAYYLGRDRGEQTNLFRQVDGGKQRRLNW